MESIVDCFRYVCSVMSMNVNSYTKENFAIGQYKLQNHWLFEISPPNNKSEQSWAFWWAQFYLELNISQPQNLLFSSNYIAKVTC